MSNSARTDTATLLPLPIALTASLLLFLPLWLGACGSDDAESILADGPAGDGRSSLMGSIFEIQDELIERAGPAANPDRSAYFGDLHVHTTYSFDAYVMGTLATPYDAYRFARGEPIAHPAGFDLQLDEPLDFYAVTDHAMFLGVAQASGDTTTEFSQREIARQLNDINAPDNMGITSVLERIQAFGQFLPKLAGAVRDGDLEAETVLEITRDAWSDIVDAAEQFNDPGQFTTFVAYEYTTSTADFGNLHRNLIFKNGDKIPALPFSRFHSANPEDLWDWMDGLRAQGIEALAIPHNSNGSNGQMFKLVDWAGDPIDDDYAEQRLRNEPLVEITQIKGTSETHPLLSSEDEWADFEIMPFRVATMRDSVPEGGYVRDALRRGLALEKQGITNPYEFGLIGSSDTHTGTAQNDESDYVSKLGLLSSNAELRGSVPLHPLLAAAIRFFAPDAAREVEGETYVRAATPTYGASGLAAVWAEENTRESLYEAFRRKETFATSGPRIQLRFFAGYGFDPKVIDSPAFVEKAYAKGVSMGGELAPSSGPSPRFLVHALRDPKTVPLQRLQIIKGWSDTRGDTFERVYDIACASGAAIDPVTQRCPDNGASVDLSDCTPKGGGDAQLRAIWLDPDFDPQERAFYYVRVLENPTCRWSTYDALRAGVEPRPDLPKTIQERAWSSPIHYKPTS